MVKAYVLIKVDGVDINKVANNINALEEVENLHQIYGGFDLIAIIKTKNIIKLKEDVIEKINKIKGVSETSCMIVADED